MDDAPAWDELSSADLLGLSLQVSGCTNEVMVEVAGVEPASFGTSPGLLRAQPALLFSAPAVMQASRRTGSAAVRCPA